MAFPTNSLRAAVVIAGLAFLPGLTTVVTADECPRAGRGWWQPCRIENEPCALFTGACKTVTIRGFIDSITCKCRKRKGLRGAAIEMSGAWRAISDVPFMPETVATIMLAGDVPADWNPYLAVFDFGDVDENGNVVDPQVIGDPGGFFGVCQIRFGDGPPESIPAEIMMLDWHLASVEFLGEPVGEGAIQLLNDPLNGTGVYDSINGELKFDEGVWALYYNSRFPDGVRTMIRPVFTWSPEGYFELLPDMSVRVPLTLHAPSPGNAGVINTFEVDGAGVDQTIHFVYGLRTGSTNVPACSGLTVELSNPVIFGSTVADDAGRATIDVNVPPAASGRTVYFQAVEQFTCTVSNLVQHRFP